MLCQHMQTRNFWVLRKAQALDSGGGQTSQFLAYHCRLRQLGTQVRSADQAAGLTATQRVIVSPLGAVFGPIRSA